MNTVPPSDPPPAEEPGHPPYKPDRLFIGGCLLVVTIWFLMGIDLSSPSDMFLPVSLIIFAAIELVPARYVRLTRWVRIGMLTFMLLAAILTLATDL